MARLTRNTLKYMGAAQKDSVLPSPDTVLGYSQDLQQAANDLWSAMVKWRKDSEILQTAPLLAEYEPDLIDMLAQLKAKADDYQIIAGDVADLIRSAGGKIMDDMDKNGNSPMGL